MNILIIITIIHTISSKYFSLKVQKEKEGMYYYGKIKILKYSQIKTLILDTGSNLLAVPCMQSTIDTYKQINNKPEPFHLNFAEGSEIRGNSIVEKIKINYSEDKFITLPKSNIACIMTRDGLFQKQFANGIIGLNYSSEFLNGFDGKGLLNLQFCLGEKEGRVDFFKNKLVENNWDFEFEFNDFFSGYSIRFGKVLLAGGLVIEKEFQLNFDYGTTFLFLPNAIFKAFFLSLNEFCVKEERNCGTFDSMEVSDCLEFITPDDNFEDMEDLMGTFPDLSFRIEQDGVVRDLNISPDQYFWIDENDDEVEEGATKFCMGLREHQFHFVILGNNSLRNKKVFVDRSKMIVKMKQVDCDQEIQMPLELEEKPIKIKKNLIV